MATLEELLAEKARRASENEKRAQAARLTPDNDLEALKAEKARREALKAQTPEEGFVGESGAVAEQFNVGLANILGLPVDAVNFAMRQLGVDVPEGGTFGGSGSIKRGMQDLGVINAPEGLQPQTGVGRFAGAVAREAGASVVPAGATFAAAPKLAAASSPVLQMIGKGITEAPKAAAGAEALSAVGAGLGGETARTVAPGNRTAEVVGTLAGGLGLSSAPTALRAATRGVNQADDIARATQDFAEAGVRPTAAEVSERGAARMLRSAASKIPGGAGRVAKETKRISDEFAQRTRELTGSESLSAERAGRVIKKGLIGEAGFTTRFQQSSEGLYDNLSAKIGDDTFIDVSSTRKALGGLADPVPDAPATSATLANEKVLQIAKAVDADIEALAPRSNSELPMLPFSAVKQLRTKVGQLLSSNEIISEAPRTDLKRLYAALSDDIGEAAMKAGAEREFKRASSHWKAGLKRVDDHLKGIANKVNDEDVFLAATRGKEGATRIRAVRKSLTKAEWNTVAKTMLRRMGQPTPGQADEFGEGFSVERWLTDMNRLSPEARDAVFGGTDLNGAVRKLQKVAGAVRRTGRTGANPSGTAQGAAQIAVVGSAATSVASGSMTPIFIAGLTSLSANRAAALLSSPAFVRWLARSSELSAAQLPAHIGKLSNIGKRDPSLEPALQEYLDQLTFEEAE